MNSPTPDKVRAAREAAGLTQAEAGALVYVGYRTWQKWEHGSRAMHRAYWELFRLKSGLDCSSPAHNVADPPNGGS